MTTVQDDTVFYRDGMGTALARTLLKRARHAMFDLFMGDLQPTAATRIVDIGVSDEENDESNFLEKLYPWPHNITCAGLGSGEQVRRAFPGIAFHQLRPGERLPFADGAFDIAYSNAVLEHVGGVRERAHFISEHLRVARRVFLAFPNRWFPIEHHTSLPVLHYAPGLFRHMLRGSRLSYWAEPRHLDFLDRRTVCSEWPGPCTAVYTGIWLGPLSSNVAVIYK